MMLWIRVLEKKRIKGDKDMGKSLLCISVAEEQEALPALLALVPFCNWSTLVFMDVSLHKH